MLTSADEPPAAQGDSSERAAKYAKHTDRRRRLQNGERLVLGDITNVSAMPCQVERTAVASLTHLPASKFTPPPSRDEAESTGLGCLRDVSFSNEEDDNEFCMSDFEDFPAVEPGGSFHEEINHLAGNFAPEEMHLKRSASPAKEAGGRDDSPVLRCPSWRSPKRGSAVWLYCTEGSGVLELPDWHLGPREGEAGGSGGRPATEAAVPAGGHKVEHAAMRLLSAPRLEQEAPEEDGARCPGMGLAGDQSGWEDTQDVPEYAPEVYSDLGLEDTLPQMPSPDYMQGQPELNSHMRAVAVDWLVEVQVKFKLRTPTLFLSVSLLDRFLATKRVRRSDLQLIVVTATFIAAKFEENDPPDVRDKWRLPLLTRQACPKESILEMEVAMLTTLEFCLCRPTAAHFLERYQRLNRCSKKHCHLFQYILELALTKLEMNRYSPSHQAAAALLVSCGLLRQRPVLPSAEMRQAEAAEKSIRLCAREMRTLLEAAPTSPYQAVRRKFLRPEFGSVASSDC